METIKNDILQVVISNVGAELQSIRRAGSDHEYMWQGDAKYWNRRAPVLFPMVGKVWNGEFRMDGATKPMGQHGFARDCMFRCERLSDEHVVFTLDSDEKTLELYPRQFRLVIDYELVGNELRVTWEVHNTGNRRLPFQIGAHPAFAYPEWSEDEDLHGYMTFGLEGGKQLTGKLVSTALAPGGYRSTTAPAFDVALDEANRLPLTNTAFECDTIIDARDVVRSVTMHDKHGKALLTVGFNMPIIALWSPCGGKAPFVCIEPWCGACDTEGYCGEYEDRDLVSNLLPGETFKTTYSVAVER